LAALDAGGTPTAWPSCIPNQHRAKLNSRFGLRKRLVALWHAYCGLTVGERRLLQDAINQQTNLPAVLANDGPCAKLGDLPGVFRGVITDLFTYMFDQLATLIEEGNRNIRDIQYSAIYKELGARICPYCGLNYFRAPGAPRHALDHFMPISRYPFVGSDLRNLPPVCEECNSRFKGDCDVLFDNEGQRRRCSYCYDGPTYHVRLSASVLFAGNEIKGFRLPRWEIELVGDPPEQAQTWDAIYRIRERYGRDVLDADFLSWIGHFANWFKRQIGPGKNPDEVAAELPRYIDGVIQDGFADRAFLKAEAFRLIHRGCGCSARGDEVRKWLWAFVEYAV
jgi:hypothetical protein